jgi:hypothetical protein
MNRIIDRDVEVTNLRQHIVYGVGRLFSFTLASSSRTWWFMDTARPRPRSAPCRNSSRSEYWRCYRRFKIIISAATQISVGHAALSSPARLPPAASQLMRTGTIRVPGPQ